MRKTTIEEIIAAAGGSLIQRAPGPEAQAITGVKHDSREVEERDMFVAVVGENQDGHRYISQVAARGCRTVLVSHREGWMEELAGMGMSINAILVEDTVAAAGRIAKWYLESLNIPRVAVTGSVGKTSTRDMIYYVLSEKYSCGRNLKNYNNNIGLPLSIFRFDSSTQTAVLEMGMDAFGEIEYLSDIVQPRIGVITNIGVAHMEKLGSREGIFRAKMEITKNIAGSRDGGTLIYAGDNEFLTRERTAGDYCQLEVGSGPEADFKISDVDDFGIEGIEFNVEYQGESAKARLPVPGVHNATNAGLAKAELTGSRLKKIQGKSITIIDDTYNANPDSMKSAIDVLARSRAARRIAILGDMFELGENTAAQHREVGEHAALMNIDEVICIGALAGEIAAGASGIHFPDKESFIKVIDEYIAPGDLVLVKASRGMKMEEIVSELEEK